MGGVSASAVQVQEGQSSAARYQLPYLNAMVLLQSATGEAMPITCIRCACTARLSSKIQEYSSRQTQASTTCSNMLCECIYTVARLVTLLSARIPYRSQAGERHQAYLLENMVLSYRKLTRVPVFLASLPFKGLSASSLEAAPRWKCCLYCFLFRLYANSER